MARITTKRTIMGRLRYFGIMIMCAGLVLNSAGALADEHSGHWGRDFDHPDYARHDHDRYDYDHRGYERHGRDFHGPWHFEPRHGWRFERHPGIWSPFYVWWWLDGRAVLGLVPDHTIVRYSNGYYELRGDGMGVPYYWVWVPTIAAPPPQPPEVPPEPAPIAPPPPPEIHGESAPAPPTSGPNTVGGTIIGGAVGGAIGSTMGRGPGRITGVIVGTLLGALVGHSIGKSLDEADELRAAYALEKNKTGQTSTWVNPDSGAKISVEPTRTFQESSGQYCREYKTTVLVEGKQQEATGTACRQPDGQWKIVK
ncbi:MAG: RT0821/Lpp0805 family surface protein [Desulfobacteraceae bacterium]|nr:RT0821/Lpp0805 family surface protein [Desulfobacteraceae bacterium]